MKNTRKVKTATTTALIANAALCIVYFVDTGLNPNYKALALIQLIALAATAFQYNAWMPVAKKMDNGMSRKQAIESL